MTDACTPPLDLGSDSGEDDYCTEMRSPSSPPPASSILHLRKRKDSHEHLSPAHPLFDRNQELPLQPFNQVDDGFFASPSPSTKSKGARGRRPTVTFEIDSIPTARRRCHFRHDDGDDDDALDSDRDEGGQDSEDDADHCGKNDEAVPDSLLQAERALRRVSLTPLVDFTQESNCTDNNIDALVEEQTQACSTDSTALLASTLSSSTTANASSFPSELGPSTTTTTTTLENSAPKEIILNHILTEPAPQDMLVALINRSSELEALAAFHSEFFRLLYASVPASSREAFKTILFSPRSQLCDREWMQTIASDSYLLGHPCLLEKFKAIVGWIGPDGDLDGGDSDRSDLQLWGEDEYGYRDSSFEQVQIKWLRDLEDFPIETFEEYYPQFFINAREKLQGRRMSHGGDSRDHYLIFRETLNLSRQELACDNAWTRRMNGCLEKHPELLLQLKEIVAYEVGYDD